MSMYFYDPYLGYSQPFDQDPYFSSIPSYPEFDERIFGPGFPSLGGSIGGPPGPPPGFPQGPSGFPPGPPPGQGPEAGPPTSPPPSFVPAQTQQVGAFAVDPGSIRRCLFRFTYVWLRNRQQFWFYPVFIGRNSISGYRWTGFRWVFFGISLRQIESFTCV